MENTRDVLAVFGLMLRIDWYIWYIYIHLTSQKQKERDAGKRNVVPFLS